MSKCEGVLYPGIQVGYSCESVIADSQRSLFSFFQSSKRRLFISGGVDSALTTPLKTQFNSAATKKAGSFTNGTPALRELACG